MTSAVIVAIRVKADPQRAFAVFTGDIGAWWRPGGLFQITPRGDGNLRFEGGEGGRLVTDLPNGKIFEIGDIRVWSPGERLVVGWRQAGFAPDQETELEVRFEAVGESETRVTVEHRAWDSIPREHVARHGFPLDHFQMRAAEWWRSGLRAFASVAEAGEES